MGYEPEIRFDLTDDSQQPLDQKQHMERLASLRDQLKKRWMDAVESQARNYNQRHKPIAFKSHDLVVVATKDLRLKLPSRKLAPRYIGPFSVIEPVGSQAYRLRLPEDWRIHDVINVARLEPYYQREGQEQPEIPDILINEEDSADWVVQSVQDKREIDGRTEYLMRWASNYASHEGWIAEDEIPNDKGLVRSPAGLIWQYNFTQLQRDRAKATQLNS